MEYREIVSVTRLGGLFQLLATKSDGAIVKSLADNATKFISARLHNVTPLESIEVYTTGDNVRLHEIFTQMQENESKTPLADAKTANNDAIKQYFKKVVPEMDEDRVYVSDMKKMLKWYELLKANDLLHFEALQPQAEEATEAPAEEAEKPAKKATKAKKEETEEATAEGEEKPAKKAAPKKAAKKAAEPAADGEEKPAKKTAAKKKKTEE